MPASNVQWGPPLTRLWPFYPGQWGVRGSDNDRGLRLSTDGVVFYVNPNHPDANDAGDGTNPDYPLASVGAAILLCQPYRGDIIAVMANNAWQYGNVLDGYTTPIAENVTVDVPGVRIVGISQSSSTGVVWEPTDDNQTLVTVTALDVSIEGFLFYASRFTGCTAISSVWDGVAAWGDNLTVRNCVFDEGLDIGVSMNYTWFANIHHNVFWGCQEYGLYDDPAGSGLANLLVSENVFHDIGTCAMFLDTTDDSHVFGNSIYNANAQGAAVATDEGVVTANGNNNQIFDNFFSCVLPAAANGDWDDLNSGSATDAWIGNKCLNGTAVTTPT